MSKTLWLRTVVSAAVAASLLAACNGGGNGAVAPLPNSPGAGQMMAPAPASTASDDTLLAQAIAHPPVSDTSGTLPTTVETSYGKVDGATGIPNGDTKLGGRGQAVDGIPCSKTMFVNDYHVHAFVGLIVNGKWMAIPGGIGMNPLPKPVNGVWNTGAQCYYHVHTHDRSGIVHIEDPNTTTSKTVARRGIGQFLDIWGVKVTTTQFGSYHGTVSVYTSGQVNRGGPGLGDQDVSSSTYTKWTGNIRKFKLFSHEVVWYVVGTPPATFPNVHFYTEW